MSKNNPQAQQSEPAKSSPGRGKEHSADIQMEIGRAFEVASAIEKAVRIEGGENLEQFLARMANLPSELADVTIYRRSEYRLVRGIERISVNISRFPDSPDTSNLSFHVQAKDSKPSSVLNRASKCLEQSGFVIADTGMESGTVSTDLLHKVEVINPELLANTLHAL